MRQTAIAIVDSLMLVLCATIVVAQGGPVLRVGLVSSVNSADSTEISVQRGVRLGAAEAHQTASLFGGDVLLFEEPSQGNPQSAARKLLVQRKVQILIGSSARDADALSRFAESRHALFFNVASRAPALRAACRRYTFHIEASDSMYANAVRRASRQTLPSTASAVLWAPSLVRYGASQINDRFRSRYHASMDGAAWAGWVAVKIASEAALRARSGNAGAMLSYLESGTTSFDGHKGWPLSFSSADHQLRQPLYVVPAAGSRAGGTPRDVPELSAIAGGSAAAADAKQALDALIPTHAPRCAWSSR